MRTVAFDRDMVELSIKPTKLLKEYRQLLVEDAHELLNGDLRDVQCPGCREDKSETAFDKNGYTYRRCLHCESLYVSPRPEQADLDRFYQQGRASRFWRERILQETVDARRIKIMRPRARWVLDAMDKYLSSPKTGVSVGYHNQILIEELKALEPELVPLKVVSPIADEEFAQMNLDGVSIHTGQVYEAIGDENPDMIMLFDCIDRVADPEALIQYTAANMNTKGLLLGNTILASGFDIQNLWEHTPSVYPPERLNLFSVEGLTALFRRHRLQTLEFSTPGTFDVEIVRQYIQNHPDENWPGFIRYLVNHRDETAMHELQTFLQQHLMSSFCRFVVTPEA